MGEFPFELGAVLDASVRGGLIHESDAAIVREVPSESTQEIVDRLYDAFNGVSEGRLRAVLGQVSGLRPDHIEDFVTLVLEKDPGEALQRAARLFAANPPTGSALIPAIALNTESESGGHADSSSNILTLAQFRELRPSLFTWKNNPLREIFEFAGAYRGWEYRDSVFFGDSLLHGNVAELHGTLGPFMEQGFSIGQESAQRAYDLVVAIQRDLSAERFGDERWDTVKDNLDGAHVILKALVEELRGSQAPIDGKEPPPAPEPQARELPALVVDEARDALPLNRLAMGQAEYAKRLWRLLLDLPDTYEARQAATDDQALEWFGRLAALYYEQGRRDVFPDSLIELIGRAQTGTPLLRSSELDKIMRLIECVWAFAQEYQAQHGASYQIPFVIYRGTRAVVNVLASRLPEALLRQVMPHGFFDGNWFVARSEEPSVPRPILDEPRPVRFRLVPLFSGRVPLFGPLPRRPRPPSALARFRAWINDPFGRSAAPAGPSRPPESERRHPRVRVVGHSGGLSPPVLPPGLLLGANRHVRGPLGIALRHPLAMPIPQALYERLMGNPAVLKVRGLVESPVITDLETNLVLIHEGTLGLGTAIQSAFSLPAVPEVLIFRNDGAVFAFYEAEGEDRLFELPWKAYWLEEGRQPPEPAVQLAVRHGFERISSTSLPLFIKEGRTCVVFHVTNERTRQESLEAVYLGGGMENIGGRNWAGRALYYPLQGIPSTATAEPTVGPGDAVLVPFYTFGPEVSDRVRRGLEQSRETFERLAASLLKKAGEFNMSPEQRELLEKMQSDPLSLDRGDWEQFDHLLKPEAVRDFVLAGFDSVNGPRFLDFLEAAIGSRLIYGYDGSPIVLSIRGGSGLMLSWTDKQFGAALGLLNRLRLGFSRISRIGGPDRLRGIWSLEKGGVPAEVMLQDILGKKPVLVIRAGPMFRMYGSKIPIILTTDEIERLVSQSQEDRQLQAFLRPFSALRIAPSGADEWFTLAVDEYGRLSQPGQVLPLAKPVPAEGARILPFPLGAGRDSSGPQVLPLAKPVPAEGARILPFPLGAGRDSSGPVDDPLPRPREAAQERLLKAEKQKQAVKINAAVLKVLAGHLLTAAQWKKAEGSLLEKLKSEPLQLWEAEWIELFNLLTAEPAVSEKMKDAIHPDHWDLFMEFLKMVAGRPSTYDGKTPITGKPISGGSGSPSADPFIGFAGMVAQAFSLSEPEAACVAGRLREVLDGHWSVRTGFPRVTNVRKVTVSDNGIFLERHDTRYGMKSSSVRVKARGDDLVFVWGHFSEKTTTVLKNFREHARSAVAAGASHQRPEKPRPPGFFAYREVVEPQGFLARAGGVSVHHDDWSGPGDPVFGVTGGGSMSEIRAVPETGSRLARVTRGRDDTLGTRLAQVAASRGLGETAATILRLSEDQLRALVRHSASWKEAAARRGFSAGIASSAQLSTVTDRALALLAIAAGSQQDLSILAGMKAAGPTSGAPVLPFPGTTAAIPIPAPSLPLMLAR